MRTRVALLLGMVMALALAVFAGVVYLRLTHLTTRAAPGAAETRVARAAHRLAIPAAMRATPNPVPVSADALAEGMSHFADHCAVCHAPNGSGATEMGRGFYPPVPDMRRLPTQEL